MMPHCGGAIAGNSWTNPCSRNSSSPNRSTTSIAPATGTPKGAATSTAACAGIHGSGEPEPTPDIPPGKRPHLTEEHEAGHYALPDEAPVSRMNEVRAGNGPCGATRNGMIHHTMRPIGAATANQMARILARLYWPPNSASRAIATESAASSRCPTAGCRAHASTSDSAGEEERRTLLPPPRRRRDRTRWASRSTPAIEYPIPI
jgi:hypothetical protein